MKPFAHVASAAVSMAEPNIDTDQILPTRFLKKPRSGGLGQFLFHDRRFRPDGSENPEFALNRPPFRGARIIVAGKNFGCGSARENAVWAIHDYGIRVVVAPSFGDLFYDNSLENGLLPVQLPAEAVSSLFTQLAQTPDRPIEVDLAAQTVAFRGGPIHRFDIDPFAKRCLLEGLDELDYTLARIVEIKAFESQRQDGDF